MYRRTPWILAALLVSLLGAAPARAQTGLWVGADSTRAFVRVDMNLQRRAGGPWLAHVAYTDTRTGEVICRTPLRHVSGEESAYEFAEVLCGGGALRLAHEGRQIRFGRSGGSGRPGEISEVVLEYSGPQSAQPIQLGQIVSGRLESGDQVLSNETFYDDYILTAPSAMSLRVTMRSPDFNSYVFVAHGDPAHVKGSGTQSPRGASDAEVTMDVPAGARVRIRANSSGTGMQGAYTVQVTAN